MSKENLTKIQESGGVEGASLQGGQVRKKREVSICTTP